MENVLNTIYKVIVADSVWNDIERIYEYYLTQSMSHEVQRMMKERLLRSIFGLSFMPYSYPLVFGLSEYNYRKTFCGDYVIPFLIDEDTKTILVSRVFHGRSNYQDYL